MIYAGTAILATVSGCLLICVATVFTEVMASISYRPRPDTSNGSCPPLGILVPAHDEARTIGPTVESLLRQLRAGDRIVVVADNCTDDTADIARAMGAEVVERKDPTRRGKGFALEYGVSQLKLRGDVAVVVFVDADCQALGNAVVEVAGLAHRSGRPVQGSYLLSAGAAGSIGARFSEFAIRLKSYVRPLGCLQLGTACPITGSGFAVPMHLLDRVRLGSDNIVEDLVLGIDLALAGSPPLFCPSASITSPLPASSAVQSTQRTRWEQGYLAAIAQCGPRILGKALSKGEWRLGALALDLFVPPLALLCLLMLGMTLLATLWLWVAGSTLPIMIQLLSLTLLTFTIIFAWWRHGRDLISSVELLYVPVYILRKVPMYVSMALGRRVGWVRSGRE
jgi:cellulose synthase/poly-beta-1,6-N-acetylglucosamine synthase-like glycosyltransferase